MKPPSLIIKEVFATMHEHDCSCGTMPSLFSFATYQSPGESKVWLQLMVRKLAAEGLA